MRFAVLAGSGAFIVFVACSSSDNADQTSLQCFHDPEFSLNSTNVDGPHDCECLHGSDWKIGHADSTPRSSCSATDGMACCKTSAWPAQGNACFCALQFVLAQCATEDDECVCSVKPFTPDPGGVATSVCTAPAGGSCCLDGDDSCTCSKAAQCPSGEQQVDSCGVGTPICPTMTTEVPSCSAGLDVVTVGSDTGGSSSSSGDVSSSSSSSGAASCTATGDGRCDGVPCTCGLSCLQIEDLTFECLWPCGRDADCAGKVDPYNGHARPTCAIQSQYGYASYCSGPD